MLDFTCCDSLITNFPGMNKESGAGARSLQRPYFLSAQCAYPIKRGTLSPGGFLFHRTNFSIKKRTAYPPQKAVLRHDLKPSHY